MIVDIGPDWRLVSDPLQWVVQKRVKAKATKHQWKSLGFHKNVGGALLQLAGRRVREIPGTYGPEALEPLTAALDAMREDINRALVDVPRTPTTQSVSPPVTRAA